MFAEACGLIDAVLTGSVRQHILDEVSRSGVFATALERLRERMRTNSWRIGGRHNALDQIVRKYDFQVRQSGFHVLHDWDGRADRVLDTTIAIDVLNYVLDQRGNGPLDRGALAILLDYHVMNLLALLAMVVWEEGDSDRNFECLNRLLASLQGPDGSGQRFTANAETLLLIATSHYEPDEGGFSPLLDKVRTLNRRHRTNIALSHAAGMGCHLRFGFEATYARDTIVMRDDNAVDYPWLCFALLTLMQEYASAPDAAARTAVVEAMLNGLTADARAFIGKRPPRSLSRCETERAEFCARFEQHRSELVEEFQTYRPADGAYSPLSFFFNFSHNVLKGIVIDALLRGRPWELMFNDLLTTSPPSEEANRSKQELATILMGYARAHPDRIRGQLMPVIVYDPQAGRRAFSITMQKLME